MYKIEFRKRAIKDLKKIAKPQQQRIIEKVEQMESGISGDVKKLADTLPEYRLRVGSFRVLFEIEKDSIIIYRIVHRKDAYQ